MKNLLSALIVGFAFFSQGALSCDEQCLRGKAEAANKVTFPAYLTFKYCENITTDFMSSTVRSLDSYRSKHFNTKFKGPLKNTRGYLQQRREWLKECDDYLTKTKDVRVFEDDKTTQQIFALIDSVDSEFTALINGASYGSEAEAKAVMDEKIDTLFKIVDDHKTIMHLKGRYVIR